MLFLLVTTLDGVDGELARQKMQETDFGAALDLITDAIVNPLLGVPPVNALSKPRIDLLHRLTAE